MRCVEPLPWAGRWMVARAGGWTMFGDGKGNKGFTLIELLVVIAIIAILAAILFPVFTRAKMAAQRSACLSNLRQLGTACHLYADKWDDYYPPARVGYWPWGNFADPRYSFRPLERYLKSIDVLFCPTQDRYVPHEDWGPGTGYYCGYCYWAGYIDPRWKLDKTKVAVKAGEYPKTLLISDLIVTYPDGSPYPLNNHTKTENQGGNLLYNDGHAKWKNFVEMELYAETGGIAGIPRIDFWW